ncbi:MAG: penicillin acylase family protein, partial [Actinomycetota bacterium]|nr:penicillin acylase family protein [Actinomycetota bacterium]
MRRTRGLLVVLAIGSLGLGSGVAAAAGAPDPAAGVAVASDPQSVLNIVPPGSSGFYTAADVGPDNLAAKARAYGPYPPNHVDQLQMYDALNRLTPGQLADGDLGKYFKTAQLGVDPADVVKTERPRDGVTILRDKAGVPHVYGVTDADTSYGAGYAGTQDRMFLQDLLRHVGAARLGEFLGGSQANIAMDSAQLAVADYTPEEANAQIDNIVTRYPAEGARLRDQLDAFLNGINDAQNASCPAALPLAPTCPAEYLAFQRAPAPFTRADIVYIASLVGGIFGKGGGGEYDNAIWLQKLTAKFGDADGRKVFDDLREQDDPEAPTTLTTPFPYEKVAPSSVLAGANVLPDVGGTRSPGTGCADTVPPASSTPCDTSMLPPSFTLDGPLGKIRLDLRHSGMSNALLVDAAHSASGHPTVVFGPQTAYFSPQLLTEVDLHGPHQAARGVSFAGTQLVVELGRGLDYAWSATSASGDNVDTVVEKLCSLDPAKPVTTDSKAYLDGDGACVPMTQIQHRELTKPTVGGVGPDVIVDLLDLRTRHGIVSFRTTAGKGGTPIAIVTERSTYTRELDSAIGFARINDPTYTHDAASFQSAFEGVDYSFNWFYADAKDIAYKESGRLPVRAAGVDPDLPRSGERKWDNTGLLAQPALPHAINPPAGFLANWNNKPAPGFAAADNDWGYGSIYRNETLRDSILTPSISGWPKVTRPGLVSAMLNGATVDVRAAYLLPELLAVIGDGGYPIGSTQAQALAGLRTWLAHGAHREDRDQANGYTDQAAIALFDEWWESQTTKTKGQFALPKDVLAGTLTPALADALPQALDDHPRIGRGSAWNDVAWYGYVDKDLRQVLGSAAAPPVVGPYSRTYCGGGSPAVCMRDLRASLSAAVDREQSVQKDSLGVARPFATWTYDKTQDDIDHSQAGAVDVPNIDWQNRPTFQQVVAFSANRSAAAAPTPTVTVAARPGGSLAATGGDAVLPVPSGPPAAGRATG